MKKTFVAILAASVLSMHAHAGIEPTWKWFKIELDSAQSSLEKKKDKFSETEYSKLLAELKDAEETMFSGKGTMRREDYYNLNNLQEERVKKVKASADAKQ